MTSLLIHAGLGLICLVLFFVFNAHTYKAGWEGAAPSFLEVLYYLIAVASVCVGWYFNIQYVMADPAKAGWIDYTKNLFTNAAADSGSQDLITSNVFLFPLWTIIDGPRRGLKQCWIYFVLSLFTSFGFAMGLYLAAQERQVRWLKAQV
jgi:hypothetical protein